MSVSAELSQTIINNQVTSVLILDESLMIRYANPAAEQLFSQSAKRLMHQSLNHLVQHSSLDLQLLTQPLQSGQSITDSDVTLVIDSKPLMLEVTVSPISWHKELLLLAEMRTIGQQRLEPKNSINTLSNKRLSYWSEAWLMKSKILWVV